MTSRILFPLVVTAGTLLGLSAALAAGMHAGGHGHAAVFEFGQPADAAKATRTVQVVMRDNLTNRNPLP